MTDTQSDSWDSHSEVGGNSRTRTLRPGCWASPSPRLVQGPGHHPLLAWPRGDPRPSWQQETTHLRGPAPVPRCIPRVPGGPLSGPAPCLTHFSQRWPWTPACFSTPLLLLFIPTLPRTQRMAPSLDPGHVHLGWSCGDELTWGLSPLWRGSPRSRL